MSIIQKSIKHKYWWLGVLAFFVALTYIASLFHYRADLTAEKRFSLSNATRKILNNIDTPVMVQVFLTGDLPADYKKLGSATSDLLNEFRDLSGNKVRVRFERPGADLADTERLALYDSLARMGVVFEQSEDMAAGNNDKSVNQLIIPSALVFRGNRPPVVIDLRSSRKVFKNFNVLNDVPQEDKEATRNAAEALLEYKFANAIDRLTRKYVPTIAYAIGNGEPGSARVYDLIQSMRNDYRLGIFDLKQSYPNPQQIDALMIVKPTQQFTDEDKLKIDQYVMHGGKVLWFVDKLYAELDSLMRSKADFVAYDRNLDLDDLLFKYGVRVNGDLLQDLNCSKIPVVVGYNPDNSPRMQRIPFPYYPFLSAPNNNPISKNLDRVLPIFPSSIDTVKAEGIRKTVLLATDTNSRSLSSPAMVTINIPTEQELLTFNKSHVPVSVLLEGRFRSLFANRLTQQVKDSVANALGKPFAEVAEQPTQQIVTSDGDMVTNAVSNTTGPLAMGMLPMENYRFANREYLLNCLDYLVSNNGLYEARNKDVTLRLLDKQKVAGQRTRWQLVNIGLPVALVLLAGLIFQWQRKRKYAA
ncbi:gliding motility-associated ABC transporter substrate-binding protein GldG [Deminuibacter soli]|uniref:Gliding motility-associated ABC transporter substrate-binding protein GldG n=1 Tax=Deminuibacter soli TaxID=2291815 RepID=A0A3E1NP34_9BACT|nr:gliding motility-associated ABC transporter substrate-binding protein GldG [Deminuibacter soli]RFM29701.1 gliding motility-associated ABC transporter substrate-binding protein GldG [Deminuibacter soli]